MKRINSNRLAQKRYVLRSVWLLCLLAFQSIFIFVQEINDRNLRRIIAEPQSVRTNPLAFVVLELLAEYCEEMVCHSAYFLSKAVTVC